MKDHTPYQEISRRITSALTLQRLLKDLRVLNGEEKEDQLQDAILLTLQLMKRYPHFTEEDITGKPFEALLRIAYERDLIDRLERRCKTWVWEEDDEATKKRKKREMRIEKVAWVEELDPEERYENMNETDGRVTLPRLENPEAVYVINLILGKMKRVFVDRWAIVGELLANEGLADYVGGIVPRTPLSV